MNLLAIGQAANTVWDRYDARKVGREDREYALGQREQAKTDRQASEAEKAAAKEFGRIIVEATQGTPEEIRQRLPQLTQKVQGIKNLRPELLAKWAEIQQNLQKQGQDAIGSQQAATQGAVQETWKSNPELGAEMEGANFQETYGRKQTGEDFLGRAQRREAAKAQQAQAQQAQDLTRQRTEADIGRINRSNQPEPATPLDPQKVQDRIYKLQDRASKTWNSRWMVPDPRMGGKVKMVKPGAPAKDEEEFVNMFLEDELPKSFPNYDVSKFLVKKPIGGTPEPAIGPPVSKMAVPSGSNPAAPNNFANVAGAAAGQLNIGATDSTVAQPRVAPVPQVPPQGGAPDPELQEALADFKKARSMPQFQNMSPQELLAKMQVPPAIASRILQMSGGAP